MRQHRATTSGPIARRAALPAVALALALGLALAGPVRAQDAGSVQDFRLPPGSATPTSSAAGPVDAEHPTAEPTRPAPAPTPAPPPAPAASPAPPVIALPPVAASPARAPGAAAPARSAPPRETPPAPAPSPAGAPLPGPTLAAPTLAAPTLAAPPVVASTSAASPVATPAAATAPPPGAAAAPWPWIAGGLFALLLLGAFLLRRRRGEPEAEPAPAEMPSGRVQPEPSPPAALTPPAELNPAEPPVRPAEPAPANPPAPEPVAPNAAPVRPLEMTLEARYLSRALVNATLAYRLTLTNHAEGSTGPLRIAGDIVSAHASLPPEAQLAPGDVALATIHEVPPLAPGESTVLSGELRLPIASILPIHSGTARVFVPLARFRAESTEGPAAVRVFVIGQASEEPGGALRPFPLDRGPGVDRGLGQRELALPA